MAQDLIIHFLFSSLELLPSYHSIHTCGMDLHTMTLHWLWGHTTDDKNCIRYS